MGSRIEVRGIGLGILGGLIGTIMMDIVMVVTFISVGEPADLFFSMVGEKLGGCALVGIAVHNLVGVTGGILFALLVMGIPALHVDSMRKGLLLGVAAGAVTIPLGCVPLAIWLGESIMAVIAFSILPHFVWGTILGWTYARGMISVKIKSKSTQT